MVKICKRDEALSLGVGMKERPSRKAYLTIAAAGAATAITLEVLAARSENYDVFISSGIAGVLFLGGIPLVVSRFLGVRAALVALVLLALGVAQSKLNFVGAPRQHNESLTAPTRERVQTVDISGGHELWLNAEDGIAAYFPTPPERVNVATQDEAGHAWISTVRSGEGGVLYQITVVPISTSVAPVQQRAFLESKARTFAQMVGKDPKTQSFTWATFGDGRKNLVFAFPYEAEGRRVRTEGFWLIDKKRVIKVSITYTVELPTAKVDNARMFLKGFSVLKTSTVH